VANVANVATSFGDGKTPCKSVPYGVGQKSNLPRFATFATLLKTPALERIRISNKNGVTTDIRTTNITP
jgi:hypothetical protein